jgi:GNAT superfamily N-acetyltransferase
MPEPASPHGFTPRRATAADADAVTALVHAAYRHYEPLLGRTPLPMLTDFGAAIRAHDVWLLVDDRDAVAAVLELEDRGDHLWLDNVAVHPDRQGHGLGRWLLALAESEARRLGRTEIGLLTNERYTANLAMYERHGYRETHREPYRGTDLVYFRKRLGG